MRFLICLLILFGLALSEPKELECYSCTSNGNFVPCEDTTETLERCTGENPTCYKLQIVDEQDQTWVWKACGIEGTASILDALPSSAKTVLWGGASPSPIKEVHDMVSMEFEFDGCLNMRFEEIEKSELAMCFCSTSLCNGATGLQLFGFLLAFSVILQRFLL